ARGRAARARRAGARRAPGRAASPRRVLAQELQGARMKVLIPGISGQLGRMVAERLHQAGHDVAGIDRRPWPGAPRGVKVHEHDIRKRQAEDVYRTYRPDAVVHMMLVRNRLNLVRRLVGSAVRVSVWSGAVISMIACSTECSKALST